MGGTCCSCSRKPDQVGRALLWLPWFIVNGVIEAVDSAEKKLGTPPTSIEVLIEIKMHHPCVPIRNCIEAAAVMISICREDLLYTNDMLSKFSTHKHEGFKNFSEFFRSKYEGFTLDKRQRVTCSTKQTLNFNQIVDMLKSKDQAKLDGFKNVYDQKSFTFLDGAPCPKVAFNTYPRSGNSMLRRLIEQTTGVFTGATLKLFTATSLQMMGLAGEEIIDDRVWVIKAHHPCYMPGAIPFKSSKVICCVRNPIDVFVSVASFVNTMSHSAQPEFEYHRDFPEWWTWWVKFNAEKHAQYFHTMLRHCTEEGKNPIYIVRYEDLVSDKQKELEGVMKFLLGITTLEGTNCQKRIAQICANSEASQPYRLKSTSGKLNQHASKYTKEHIEIIKKQNEDLLYLFGYAQHPEQENKTGFFQFDTHKQENLDKFYGFRKINEESIRQVSDSGWKPTEYKVNSDGVFEWLTDPVKCQEPAMAWATKKLGYGNH